MKILVYLEVQDGALTGDSLGLAEHLVGQGFDVTGVAFFGDGHVPAALSVPSVAVAVAAPDPCPVVGRVATLMGLCAAQGFDTLLFANSAQACDIAAQLSGRLDAAVLPGLVDLTIANGEPLARRTSLAESVAITASWQTAVRIGLFRPGAFGPIEGIAADHEPASVAYAATTGGVVVEACDPIERDGVSLRDADIIVGAGRGIGGPEKLDMLRELAGALGGTLGVSLPLVDAGWAPRALQVGQTGTVVSPRLYVACGISGQIQHRIGIERSGTIIAINKDRDAPIMAFCDLAVVGDLNRIVPLLIAELGA